MGLGTSLALHFKYYFASEVRFCIGKFHAKWGWWRNTGRKGDVTSLIGEGNGNHSSVLAWEIPWTEKLQSTGPDSNMAQ